MKGDTLSQSRRRKRKGTWGSASRLRIELIKDLIGPKRLKELQRKAKVAGTPAKEK